MFWKLILFCIGVHLPKIPQTYLESTDRFTHFKTEKWEINERILIILYMSKRFSIVQSSQTCLHYLRCNFFLGNNLWAISAKFACAIPIKTLPCWYGQVSHGQLVSLSLWMLQCSVGIWMASHFCGISGVSSGHAWSDMSWNILGICTAWYLFQNKWRVVGTHSQK